MMNVRLIAVTRPVIAEASTAGELVGYCARVSNPANQANTQTASRLLTYLIRNQHWSPFEMAHMVLEITTTRDIARQILRHRSFSFQEFSQRYAAVQADYVEREVRLQDHTNRQSSLVTDDLWLQDWWKEAQRRIANAAVDTYNTALENGIAKEVARAVLPEGLTQSVLYMAGTVRSWIHYCALRTEVGTQAEHREIALACEEILLREFNDLAGALHHVD